MIFIIANRRKGSAIQNKDKNVIYYFRRAVDTITREKLVKALQNAGVKQTLRKL